MVSMAGDTVKKRQHLLSRSRDLTQLSSAPGATVDIWVELIRAAIG